MTNFPPPTQDLAPTTPEPPPLPAEPRGQRGGMIVACAVIAMSVAAVLLGRDDDEGRARRERDPLKPSMQFRLSARHALGTKLLFGEAQAKSLEPLLQQVLAAAKSPADRLRAAIVAGELKGSEAALERLESQNGQELPEELRTDARILETVYTDGPEALDAGARERLRERHGWFGRLALVHGAGKGDSQRAAVTRPAVRTTLTLMLAGLGAIVGVLAGVGLLITALVLALTRQLRFTYQPPPRGAGVLLEAFAIYLAWFALLGMLGRGEGGATGRTAMQWFWAILSALAPVACLWPLVRGLRFGELRHALGWHRGRGAWREVGAGVLGYFAGLPVVAAGLVISAMLSRRTGVDASHPIVEVISANPLAVIVLLLLAAVYAPLAEETMFRGAFHAGLRRPLGVVLSALIVSFVFAIIHPQGWVGLPALGAIALVLTALREWRGSIIAPVVFHAINNGVLVIVFVLIVG